MLSGVFAPGSNGRFPDTDFVAFDGEEIIGRLRVFTYVKAGRRSLW
jgi:hypothetical protein